jgi:hypothetical protein
LLKTESTSDWFGSLYLLVGLPFPFLICSNFSKIEVLFSKSRTFLCTGPSTSNDRLGSLQILQYKYTAVRKSDIQREGVSKIGRNAADAKIQRRILEIRFGRYSSRDNYRRLMLKLFSTLKAPEGVFNDSEIKVDKSKCLDSENVGLKNRITLLNG